MSRSQLVMKNILRNRRRSLLTAASVAIAIFLLTIFVAAYRFLGASGGVADRTHLLLMVQARTSIVQPIPLSYRARIAKLSGVSVVSPVFWFDGRYKNEDTIIPAIGFDTEVFSAFFTHWKLPEDQKQAFLHEKVAALAGLHTAKRYGLKVGDRIYVSSPTYFGVGLDLIIRGIYESPPDESFLFFHWDYLNEVLGRANLTGQFWVLAKSVDDVPHLMKDIDEEFRNAEIETRTMTVKQVMLSFISWLGNVKLILVSVSGAVAFVVLLILANTMAMSIRERTAELAILRALGFRTGEVLGMITAESLVISLAGAAVGCLAAWVVCRLWRGYPVGGFLLLELEVGWPGTALGLGAATAIGLASTLIPAYRASRLSIAEALRHVG